MENSRLSSPETMLSATGRPGKSTSSMPDEMKDSYFPPWNDYWSKRIQQPPSEIQPLLPTPVSPALPVPELSLDDDNSPDSAISEPEPTCSCPRNHDCVVECFALLVGSAALLSATMQYHSDLLDFSSWNADDTTPESLKELAKLESTIRKMLQPLENVKDIGVAGVLSQQRRNSLGGFGDRDLCWRLRQHLKSMELDLVDTFAPMQHDLHLLLALMDYDDPGLQSKIEDLPITNMSAKIKLLVEANTQLIEFSVKDILVTLEELQQDFQAKVDDLAIKVDMHEIDMLLGVSKT